MSSGGHQTPMGRSEDSLSDDVNRDVCANCGQPRAYHQFTRGGARCAGGRTTFALKRPAERVPAPPPPETWKHTIIVFGTGDGPDIDQMLKAEQHAVIALDGTRSIARGALIEKEPETPSRGRFER